MMLMLPGDAGRRVGRRRQCHGRRRSWWIIHFVQFVLVLDFFHLHFDHA